MGRFPATAGLLGRQARARGAPPATFSRLGPSLSTDDGRAGEEATEVGAVTLTRDWYRLDRWTSHRHEEVQGGCGNRPCCPAFPRTDGLAEMAAFGHDTVRVDPVAGAGPPDGRTM